MQVMKSLLLACLALGLASMAIAQPAKNPDELETGEAAFEPRM